MSVLDGKYKFSLQKQDNIYGVRRYSLLFSPDKFPDPRKKADPLFLLKSPIPNIKRAVFFPSFFFY